MLYQDQPRIQFSSSSKGPAEVAKIMSRPMNVALFVSCLASSLVQTIAQLRVLSPKSLVSTLSGVNGHIEASTATFGASFFGDRVLGRLVWSESAGDHFCSEKDYELPQLDAKDKDRFLASHSGSSDGQLINIVMVRRGKCSFTQKVLIAQKKGAHAVVIVDWEDSEMTEHDLGSIIVADDGHGVDVHIPSILVAKDVGAQLIEAARNSAVVVELKWTIPTDHVVQMDKWVSSGSMESMKFLKDFAGMRKTLNKVVKFQPHFTVFSIPASDPKIYADLCSDNSGQFCAEDPDGYGAVTGQMVLEEDVRQLCIHEMTKIPTSSFTDLQAEKTVVEYAGQYWDYVQRFAEECPIDAKAKEEYRFGKACADRVARAVGLDVAKIQNCIGTTRDEKLKKERANTAWSPRALRINGWRYTGMMDADLVSRAVCSGFIRPPQECDALKQRNPFEKYDGARASDGGVSFGMFLFWIALIIVVSCLSMLFYKRSMKVHMQQTIKEEVMLEVESALASYNKLPSDL